MDRSLTTFAKLVLLGAGGLAAIAGPVLYLFPNDTAFYFAWTIKHPLTPVFMGASYFSGIGIFFVIRENRWSLARVQLPAILTFAVTMLIATLLHIPIFNWSHPVAWAWLAVYVLSPIGAGLVIARGEKNHQMPMDEKKRLPVTFKPVMTVLSVTVGLIGLALFLVPGQFSAYWAWTLTDLTSRVLGGWYLSSAALQWMLSRQSTLRTSRVGLLANILVSSLLLLGALVHFDEMNGALASIWGYIAINVVLGGYSLYVWLDSK